MRLSIFEMFGQAAKLGAVAYWRTSPRVDMILKGILNTRNALGPVPFSCDLYEEKKVAKNTWRNILLLLNFEISAVYVAQKRRVT